MNIRQAVAAGASLAGLGLLAWWFYKKQAEAQKKKQTPFLDSARKSMVLKRIDKISHDTRRYVFALSHPEQPLGLPAGKHIKLFAPNPPEATGQWNGRPDPDVVKDKIPGEIQRKYTPTSRITAKGSLELVVKVYRGGSERFPNGGKMSQHLDQMKISDTIDVQGPFGLIEYLGHGSFKVGGKKVNASKLGMLAGGTGITPMLQLMQTIADDPTDTTSASLLFGNQTPDDILCQEELEALRERFDLWYTVDRGFDTSAWPPPHQRDVSHDLSQGFIDADKIKQRFPAPGEGVAILMCGPPPMINHLKKNVLTPMGYKPEQILDF